MSKYQEKGDVVSFNHEGKRLVGEYLYSVDRKRPDGWLDLIFCIKVDEEFVRVVCSEADLKVERKI